MRWSRQVLHTPATRIRYYEDPLPLLACPILLNFVSSCSITRASVQDGLQILDRAQASNIKLNIWVYNSLMDLVAKSSRYVYNLHNLFEIEMQTLFANHDTSWVYPLTWTVLQSRSWHSRLSPTTSLGQADSLDGLAVLKRLRDEGLKPDTTTYNSLLEVYVHCASRGSKTLNDGLQVNITQVLRSEHPLTHTRIFPDYTGHEKRGSKSWWDHLQHTVGSSCKRNSLKVTLLFKPLFLSLSPSLSLLLSFSVILLPMFS